MQRRKLSIATLLTTAIALGVAPARADDIHLYYVFDLPEPGSFETVSVPLLGGAWHLGSDDGPLVTTNAFASDMRFIAGLQIGGIGNGASCGGGCIQGYALYLASPDFAGLVSDDFNISSAAWYAFPESPFGAPPGFLGSSGHDLVPTLIGFDAPPKYDGDYSGAIGKDLTFDFGTFKSDSAFIPEYALHGGRVILTIAPEPSSIVMLGLGLGICGLINRRHRSRQRLTNLLLRVSSA